VNNTFALGYEEVDQNGKVVPGTQKPAPDVLARFDPSVVTVCLPLGPGQSPVTEQWELIQLSTENHNFHLHQPRFAMLGANGGVAQDRRDDPGDREHPVHATRRVRLPLPHPRTRGRGHDGADHGGAIALLRRMMWQGDPCGRPCLPFRIADAIR
jgi:hypothetical protein